MFAILWALYTYRLVSLDDRHHDVRRSFTSERRATRRHFVEHYAESPDVCAFVDIDTARLFRRHVSSRADHSSR